MKNQTAAALAAIATSVNWDRKNFDLQAVIGAANQGKLGEPLTDWLASQGWNVTKTAEAVAAPAELTEKFALLVDLGIITVPDDYVHGKRLAVFDKQNRKKFYYFNDAINDKNFPNPTRVLKPGDKLRVRAFKQVVGGSTTSEERMAFLATQKAIHTGAQGASLVFEQKRDQLPKGKWYASFDEKERLWTDAGGRHRVPDARCYSSGVFEFRLGYFEDGWGGGNAFLCFCDVE